MVLKMPKDKKEKLGKKIGRLFNRLKNNIGKVPLEKWFLVIVLVLGALFIIVLPPGQSPDEVTHFKRAYGLSDGIIFPEEIENDGGRVGSDIPEGTDFMIREPGPGTYAELLERIDDDASEKTKQNYTGAALYNPVCYIPQTLAALVGKLFGFSVLGMAYLMKVFNFVVWIMLGYFAIKMIPKFKSAVLFILLLPITLQQATSISPDSLTIGLCVFFIAYVLYLAYEKKTLLNRKDFAILIVGAIVIGLCKIVYLPLVLILLVIPKERFKSNKQSWWFVGGLLAIVVMLNLVWLVLSSRYLIDYREGTNSSGQVMGILRNPLKYLAIMISTINEYGTMWVKNMLGMSLGSFKFSLPEVFWFISFVIMVLLCVQRSESLNFKKADRWIFGLVIVMVSGLIMTSLYIQWTPCGNSIIEGVQGRYFLPILLLVPVVMCNGDNKKECSALVSNGAIIYYSLVVNIIALVTIFTTNV